jgi:hypothetical protein
VSAEVKETVGIRKYLRNEHGLNHNSYTMAPFWRRGVDMSTRAAALFSQVAELSGSGLAETEVFEKLQDMEP